MCGDQWHLLALPVGYETGPRYQPTTSDEEAWRRFVPCFLEPNASTDRLHTSDALRGSGVQGRIAAVHGHIRLIIRPVDWGSAVAAHRCSSAHGEDRRKRRYSASDEPVLPGASSFLSGLRWRSK